MKIASPKNKIEKSDPAGCRKNVHTVLLPNNSRFVARKSKGKWQHSPPHSIRWRNQRFKILLHICSDSRAFEHSCCNQLLSLWNCRDSLTLILVDGSVLCFMITSGFRLSYFIVSRLIYSLTFAILCCICLNSIWVVT